MERPHALFLVQRRKQLGRARILKCDRAQPPLAIEPQDTGNHELAQPAVRVVEEPGPISRAAA